MQRDRNDLPAQVGEEERLERLKLTSDGDRHLHAGRIEVREAEHDERPSVLDRVAGHPPGERVRQLARAE